MAPRKSKKNSTKSSSINLDLKKASEIYTKELKMVKSLSDAAFKKLELKVNNMTILEGEDIIINGLRNFFNSENLRLTLDDIKQIATEFVPKRKKSVNKCLEQYTNVEEIKNPDDDSYYARNKKFSAMKKGKKYYVKAIYLDNMRQFSYNRLKKELSLYKTLSTLNVGPDLHDVFYCRDNDGNNKLFIVKEFLEGVSLNTYTKDNKLNENDKKAIKALIDKCYDNKIVLGYLNSQDFMVQKKNGKNIFKLTQIFNATKLDDIIEERKKESQQDLEWITSKSDSKLEDLALKKIIREKKITYNL